MSNIPEINYGDLPLLLSDQMTFGRDGELDTLTLEGLCDYPRFRQNLRTVGYVVGEKVPGFYAMYVESIDRGPRSEEVCEVSVKCVGLLETGEKRRRTLGVNGQQIAIGPLEQTVLVWDDAEQGEDPATGDPLEKVKRRVPALDEEGEVKYISIVTPSGTAERWNVRQAIVTVTDTYFTIAKPSMTVAGAESTPPNPPSTPSSPWTLYNEPMRFNHPFGWVLDSREVEVLFSNSASGGLWAVTDTYGFYLSGVPD